MRVGVNQNKVHEFCMLKMGHKRFRPDVYIVKLWHPFLSVFFYDLVSIFIFS